MPPDLTAADAARLLDAATPGQWSARLDVVSTDWVDPEDPEDGGGVAECYGPHCLADAEIMAAAPDLARAVLRLEAERDEARADVARLRILGPDTEARVTIEAREVATRMLAPVVGEWRAKVAAVEAERDKARLALALATHPDRAAERATAWKALTGESARVEWMEALLRRWLAGPGPEQAGIHAETRAALGLIEAPMDDERVEIIICGLPPPPRPPSLSDAPPSCRECGGSLEHGYGLAGGGCGPYLICESCSMVAAKDQDDG